MSEDEGDDVVEAQRVRASAAVYDPKALQRLREIDPTGVFLRRWIGLFLDDAPEKLVVIERAAAAGIPQPIRRGAHALKSYAGWLGSQPLWRVCDQLEQAADRGAVEECRRLVPALRRQLELFRDWLSGAISPRST